METEDRYHYPRIIIGHDMPNIRIFEGEVFQVYVDKNRRYDNEKESDFDTLEIRRNLDTGAIEIFQSDTDVPIVIKSFDDWYQ